MGEKSYLIIFNQYAMKKIFLIFSLFVLLLPGRALAANGDYQEPYRPQYHFSPRHGWIGDPSGLMYYQGKYHLFFWGKAESEDLVHYHQVSDNVMTDTPKGWANFTGSMVIDKQNTAGWGRNAWVAALTVYEKESKKQAQGLAFSHDGVHFSHYDQNPVLDLWSTEFRDPTVFWYEPTQRWIMVVAKARQRKVAFNTESHTLLIDRTNSSDVSIPKFKRVASAEVLPENGRLRLHIYVDKSSIEIFAGSGRSVMTLLTYAGDKQSGIETFALRPGSHADISAWMLRSIWK